MGIKVRYNTQGGFESIIASVKNIDADLKRQIRGLGEETAQTMKETIKNNKERPQAGEPTTLENNIEVEFFSDGVSWGVGEIDRLNSNAEYWRAVNYGSKHLVGKMLPFGFFSPGQGKPSSKSSREGRWQKGGSHSAIIKKPIPAMNYIQKTVDWLSRRFQQIYMRG